MTPTIKELAYAADDAYMNREEADIDNKRASFNGHEYQVFGYRSDSKTGFHVTAYQQVESPHNIIIAYRGTDPDFKNHTRTTFQDIAVDFVMVKSRINLQEKAAYAFTQEVIEKARRQGISKDQITLAGHSLGGALTEIEASKFGLRGVTFNGYGAVDLNYHLPEGGHQVVNYVMAGDVVSAASRHFGEVRILASDADVQKLHTGRYIDAPPGAPTANPLLAMNLGAHSVTHFAPKPGGDTLSVLDPAVIERYEANYQQHRAAIDRFRSDLYSHRDGLALALNHDASRNLQTTWANLPERVRRDLAELHAVSVDAPLHALVAHNRGIEGTRQVLDQAALGLHMGGQRAHESAQQWAQGIHALGQHVQTQADDVSRNALTFLPMDPMIVGGFALGAKAAGHVAQAKGDIYAQTTQLGGHIAREAAQIAADQTQTIKQVVEHGAHLAADKIKGAVHVAEAASVLALDHAIDTYRQTQAVGHAIGEAASHAYDKARHAAEAASKAVGHAYERLTHPGQGADRTAPESTQSQGQGTARPQHHDPRQPDSPDHALYNELQRRFPEASEKRLLQFTAACHVKDINAQNLDIVFFNQDKGLVALTSRGLLAEVTVIDVKHASPLPAESIQAIEQHDQQQALDQAQRQAQQAQREPQGPAHGMY